MIKADNPGMCDFPIRQESGTGNRIPSGFFACFLARTTDTAAESHRAYTNGRGARRKPKATKQVLRRHEVSGEADAPAA